MRFTLTAIQVRKPVARHRSAPTQLTTCSRTAIDCAVEFGEHGRRLLSGEGEELNGLVDLMTATFLRLESGPRRLAA